MILLYCRNIEDRRRIHNYLRDKGVLIEAVPLSEFESATYKADAGAVLLAGSVPPGLVMTIDPRLPVITIGRFPLKGSLCFREYSDPELLQILKDLSDDSLDFEYNNILFAKGKDVIYLGYRLCLTPSERAILAFLVKHAEKEIAARELSQACLGDIHLPLTNISKHISAINRKAMPIGGRKIIISPSRGNYMIGRYI